MAVVSSLKWATFAAMQDEGPEILVVLPMRIYVAPTAEIRSN